MGKGNFPINTAETPRQRVSEVFDRQAPALYNYLLFLICKEADIFVFRKQSCRKWLRLHRWVLHSVVLADRPLPAVLAVSRLGEVQLLAAQHPVVAHLWVHDSPQRAGWQKAPCGCGLLGQVRSLRRKAFTDAACAFWYPFFGSSILTFRI